MSKNRRTALTLIGSAVVALAPKCPFCFFAYFGLVGVATTSGPLYRAWLFPLAALWLAFTVAMLFYQRGGQRRFGPALIGVVAGLAIVVGKFVANYPALVYVGVAVLTTAAVWRTSLVRPPASEFCSACEQFSSIDGIRKDLKRPVELPTFGRH